MRHIMRKPALCHMQTTKAQISLHIHAVWSSLFIVLLLYTQFHDSCLVLQLCRPVCFLIKWLLWSCSFLQIPGRIWEYCLGMEKYTDDGGVSKVDDRELAKLKPPSRLDWLHTSRLMRKGTLALCGLCSFKRAWKNAFSRPLRYNLVTDIPQLLWL